jgi:hypothetical protein
MADSRKKCEALCHQSGSLLEFAAIRCCTPRVKHSSAEFSDVGAEAVDRVKQAGMDAAEAARDKVRSP